MLAFELFEFAVPLPVPRADRADDIEIPRTRLDGDAVERVGVLGSGAGDDAGFVGHGFGYFAMDTKKDFLQAVSFQALFTNPL